MKNNKLEPAVKENEVVETRDKITEIPQVTEKSGEQQVSSPAPESTPAAIYTSEPELETMSYAGIDTTAVIDISSMEVIDEEDQKAFNTWMGRIKKPKKGQKMPTDQLISEGIKLIRGISQDANRLINAASKNFADRAISIGLICLKLKELIRGSDKPWGAWTEENLPFIAIRNREKYMRLGSRPDCWPFSYLGVDRLELLCSVTKDLAGGNRIGDLFMKYGIPFDENSELNMAEFKALIDAAINNERLVRNGVEIKFKNVTNIINLGIDFDKSLIRRFKDAKDSGGNPDTLAEKIILIGGKEDMDITPEKRLQDFNILTNRLIKTLDFIMGDQDQLIKIDRDTFRLLYEKLVSIHELGILEAADKAA
jgi:hypothetical protein